MNMLSAEQRTALFVRISELSGDNEEIMNTLAEIQQDDTERGGTTSNYSESDVLDKDGVRWQKKYEDLKIKYRERFFSGSVNEADPDPEPTGDNSEDITFDDLFKKE